MEKKVRKIVVWGNKFATLVDALKSVCRFYGSLDDNCAVVLAQAICRHETNPNFSPVQHASRMFDAVNSVDHNQGLGIYMPASILFSPDGEFGYVTPTSGTVISGSCSRTEEWTLTICFPNGSLIRALDHLTELQWQYPIVYLTNTVDNYELKYGWDHIEELSEEVDIDDVVTVSGKIGLGLTIPLFHYNQRYREKFAGINPYNRSAKEVQQQFQRIYRDLELELSKKYELLAQE